MAHSLDEYIQKSRRYDDMDGVGDLSFGIFFLTFALLFCLYTYLPKESILMQSWYPMALLFAILIPLCLGSHFGVKWFRERFTFRRTGYVGYTNKKRTATILVFSCVLAAAFAAAIARLPGLNWALVTGVGLAVALAYRFTRTRILRHGALAIYTILAGLVVEYMVPGNGRDYRTVNGEGLMWFYLLLGIFETVAGAIVMYRYLHQTQDVEASL